MLLNVDLTSTAVITKVPYMSTIFAHREGTSSRVDICPPSGSLCGFFYHAQKRDVAPCSVN